MLSTDVTEGNKALMADPIGKNGQKDPAVKGVLLQAKELTIRTRAGVNVLSDISFHIEPGELIALTGVSDSAKSSLLQSLAGLIKPASGEVLIDGINLYAHLKAFRTVTGFVPSELSLPPSLTVREIMHETAILRLPRRTSVRVREQRVLTLLHTLGLAEVVDHRAGSLTRMEKRKLSIAVELIGFPGLLLIDEPAEQLTPFEEIQITLLLRELCRGGLTVIQADQRSRSAGMSDKVIFLAPGGFLAWFGPPTEAFTFLRGLAPKGIAKDLFALKEAIEVLSNPQAAEGIKWGQRFKDDPAYQQYVDDPLQNRYPDLLLQTHPLLRLRNSSQEKLPPPMIPQVSLLGKFILLIGRNVRLWLRDKTVFALLALPPLIALINFVLFPTIADDPDRSSVAFGVLVFLVLLTSAVAVQNEISKERPAYERESRTSSLAFAYVLSKVAIVGLLAIYQGLVWTAMHFIATGMAAGFQVLIPYAVTFFFTACIGGLLGLIVSALSRTPMMATGWLLLFTVPQLIFSGSIIPVERLRFPFNFLSAIDPSRYAWETLFTSRLGVGSDFSLSSHWWILAIMGFFLVLLLVAIQRNAASVRI